MVRSSMMALLLALGLLSGMTLVSPHEGSKPAKAKAGMGGKVVMKVSGMT